MGKPFFSVIIPTHNSETFIARLLDSIVVQQDDDCEVVICDDGSTDRTAEIVSGYHDRLHINFFPRSGTYTVHCPGNTRNEALLRAQGEWVTFVDHDDELADGALTHVRDLLMQSEHPQVLVSGRFDEIHPERTTQDLDDGLTWVHGRFFNREFLETHGIMFLPDLIANEDLHFNSMVFGCIAGEDLSYIHTERTLYHWHIHDGSFSMSKDADGKGYLERYFDDYVTASTAAWFNCLQKYPQRRGYYFHRMVTAVLYCYFYYQAILYKYRIAVDPEKQRSIAEMFIRFCNEFETSPGAVLQWNDDHPDTYNLVRTSSLSCSVGMFVERQTFMEFIKNLLVM